MPKRVDCPIKRWPGVVTFKNPIPLADCIKLEKAFRQDKDWKIAGYEPTRSEADEIWIPVIQVCVEQFELGGGFTDNPFPGSPKISSAKLVAWLVTEILQIYANEAESVDPLA